ncbi:TPA: type II secretion system protein [Candidatus Avigastranaerophilus faecigallinarum]|nr:type II secretion system protein [Candidatus Avigastranaerophilus faecigallinarum]
MKKFAFTLSEVLITLVIIGVVAAMTIPAFLNNSNQQEYKSAIKKAISAANQALMQNYALEGLSAQDYSSAELLISEVFSRRMNVIDGESTFTSSACNGPVFTTEDGMIYCITNYSSANSDEEGFPCDFNNKTPCIASEGPNLWIDVNGVRKPNTATTSYKRPKDIYQAQIYSQRVLPYGEPTQQVMYEKNVYVSN